MFEVIVIIAVVLAVAIAVILILAATKPDTFRIERSTTINAPPEKIFAVLSDFHQWTGWSPWEHRDPALKRTFSGAERGTGAIYAWEGNKNVGTGRMEILQANAPSKLVIKLDFFKPFEAHNRATFAMTPQSDQAGERTEVTWTPGRAASAPFTALRQCPQLMPSMWSVSLRMGSSLRVGAAPTRRDTI